MKPKGDIVITKLGDTSILVPVGEAAGTFHGVVQMNETAADIWNGLTAGLSLEQIAEKLTEEYAGVDLPRARQAVQEISNQLLHEGLLEE